MANAPHYLAWHARDGVISRREHAVQRFAVPSPRSRDERTAQHSTTFANPAAHTTMTKAYWILFVCGLVLGSLAPRAAAQVIQLTDGTFGFKAVAYTLAGAPVAW